MGRRVPEGTHEFEVALGAGKLQVGAPQRQRCFSSQKKFFRGKDSGDASDR